MRIPNSAKHVVKQIIFPEGSVRTVLWGPCHGLRYRVFPGYGWAYLFGGWERQVVRVMQQNIAIGSTVYDLGANYGMHTLLFARLVGKFGRVYAFEPHPDIFLSLQEQLNLNAIETVTPVRKAVSSESGEAWFDTAQHRGAGHLASSHKGSFKVQVTTLDDFVFRENMVPPDFLKIDVEGAESATLRGGLRLLERYRPRMVIELHSPTEDRAVGAILKRLGYSAFRIRDGSRVQDLDSGWPDPNGLWGIVLCLPDLAGKLQTS